MFFSIWIQKSPHFGSLCTLSLFPLQQCWSPILMSFSQASLKFESPNKNMSSGTQCYVTHLRLFDYYKYLKIKNLHLRRMRWIVQPVHYSKSHERSQQAKLRKTPPDSPETLNEWPTTWNPTSNIKCLWCKNRCIAWQKACRVSMLTY